MKSILEKLYYGEISPCSLPTPTTERYFKAKDEVEKYGADILAKYPTARYSSKTTQMQYISPQLARDYRILKKASSSVPHL